MFDTVFESWLRWIDNLGDDTDAVCLVSFVLKWISLIFLGIIPDQEILSLSLDVNETVMFSGMTRVAVLEPAQETQKNTNIMSTEYLNMAVISPPPTINSV